MLRTFSILTVLVLATTSISAAPVTFSGTLGTLSASTTFDTAGGDLIVTLTNIGTADALLTGDILSAVFFDSAGGPLTLTPVSAVLDDGSIVLFGATDPGNVVGGEWAYRDNILNPLINRDYGISSTGLTIFGLGDLFPGNNLQGPASPDGIQYGITSPVDNPGTGDSSVTGDNALIQNSVVFTLSGLPEEFDPSTQINSVLWQYGAALSATRFPEPGTLGLLLLGGLFGFRRGR